MTIFYLITIFVVQLAGTEATNKAKSVQNIYLSKEQHLQGKVDWLVKDPEAWDAMCEWWMSEEFRTILVRNRQNRQSNPLVHHYGADDHV
jgi:hypothetical protein